MTSGGFPTIQTLLSFENDGSGNPIMVDFMGKCRTFKTRRGRSSPLQEVEAGTYEGEINNEERRLDQNYPGAIVNQNPNPSFETNTTGYTGQSATIARDAAAAIIGSFGLKVSTTNVQYSGAVRSTPISASANTAYTFSAYMKKATAGGKAMDLVINWYNAAHGLLRTDISPPVTMTTALLRADFSVTSPASTAECQLQVVTDAAIGSFDFYTDGWQLEQAAAVTTYCDGAQDNCRWSGTAHASTSYRGGPHYGKIRPLNRLFQRAVWNAVTYDVANAWVERYTQQWRLKANEASVTVEAVDLFKTLNLRLLSGGITRPEELVSARVSALATLFAFLNNNNDVSPTMTTMPAKDISHRSVLSVLKECRVTEDSRMFVGADGHFVFRQRDEDWTRTKSKTSQATFGDGVGELPYYGLELALDDDDLYNDVRVTRENGVEQAVNDATSIAAYEQRTLSISTFSDSDVDSMAMATFKLSQRKDPHLRVKSMTIRPGRDDLLWPQVLGREIGDRVTVNRRPPPSGSDVISGEYWIEGISHEVRAKERFWETVWNLWPATTRTFWILGDSTYSVLNSTTIPAY